LVFFAVSWLYYYLQKFLYRCILQMAKYTVTSLLEQAGRTKSQSEKYKREGYHTDHVVELQLVVAALNRLPKGTYKGKNWKRELVDFFNGDRNLQKRTAQGNIQKGAAVRKLIAGTNTLTPADLRWIRKIREHWARIRAQLGDFEEFKEALDSLIN